MAILKAQDIRALEKKEFAKKIAEFRREISKERGKIDVGGVPTNPGRIREMRRTIARMLTIKQEKK